MKRDHVAAWLMLLAGTIITYQLTAMMSPLALNTRDLDAFAPWFCPDARGCFRPSVPNDIGYAELVGAFAPCLLLLIAWCVSVVAKERTRVRSLVLFNALPLSGLYAVVAFLLITLQSDY